MVRQVFTYAQLLELAANLEELLEDVLVELLEVGLQRIFVLCDRIPIRVELLRRWQVLRATGGTAGDKLSGYLGRRTTAARHKRHTEARASAWWADACVSNNRGHPRRAGRAPCSGAEWSATG